MTVTTPGITLSAIEAIQGAQDTFTRAQVAYIAAVAYETGRRHTMAENIAETIHRFDTKLPDAGRCVVTRPRFKAVADRRKAARLAEYERLSGSPKFQGGLPKPASTFARESARPRFPRPEDQAAWLSAEDAAYLAREARKIRMQPHIGEAA